MPSLSWTILTLHVPFNRLRGTIVGANNRMDLLSIVTSGVNDSDIIGPVENILEVIEGWEEDETHNPDVPAISHKRGLTPFVFIPFEEVFCLPVYVMPSCSCFVWLFFGL